MRVRAQLGSIIFTFIPVRARARVSRACNEKHVINDANHTTNRRPGDGAFLPKKKAVRYKNKIKQKTETRSAAFSVSENPLLATVVHKLRESTGVIFPLN